MNINGIGQNGYFRAKPLVGTGTTRENHAELTSPKIDTFVISRESATYGAYTALVHNIAAQVVAHDSPARLEQLRQAVSTGDYQVSAQAVADAILGHAFIE